MLDGNWNILAVEYAGETMPGRTGSVRFGGAAFALQLEDQPPEMGQAELNSLGSPAALDLVWREDGGKITRRIRAIVRVRGRLMQLCYFPDDGPDRPADFESRATADRPPAVLIRCRREDPV